MILDFRVAMLLATTVDPFKLFRLENRIWFATSHSKKKFQILRRTPVCKPDNVIR